MIGGPATEIGGWGGGLSRSVGGRPHTFFREPPASRLAELGDLGGAIGASCSPREGRDRDGGGLGSARRSRAGSMPTGRLCRCGTSTCPRAGPARGRSSAQPSPRPRRPVPKPWPAALESAAALGDSPQRRPRTEVRDLFEIAPGSGTTCSPCNLRGPFPRDPRNRTRPPCRGPAGSSTSPPTPPSAARRHRAHYASSRPACSRSHAARPQHSPLVTVNAVAPGTVDGETCENSPATASELAARRADGRRPARGGRCCRRLAAERRRLVRHGHHAARGRRRRALGRLLPARHRRAVRTESAARTPEPGCLDREQDDDDGDHEGEEPHRGETGKEHDRNRRRRDRDPALPGDPAHDAVAREAASRGRARCRARGPRVPRRRGVVGMCDASSSRRLRRR